MTMPDERMRAIRFGFETLTEAVCDNTLPQALRDRAQSVLRRYPTTAQLEELLTHDSATLPPDWGEALNDARCFFHELRRRPDATEAQSWSIAVTLRHFPDEGNIKHFVSVATLQEWFELETKRR
jgi:hypothetical protein